MMNQDNKISQQTTLFGYIGEHAGVSRFSAVLNKKFKENSDDMMMIPMNIRQDDFYFTVSNMKKSHVNGAVLANEYTADVVELLDETSALVQKSGMCDIVFREGEKLRGDLFGTRVLLEYLKDIGAAKIAVVGINSHAKAFALMACGFQVSYYYDNLEELMGFCTELELQNADINRIADGMDVDFSEYDALLDFSDFNDLSMIAKVAKNNLDMKNEKEYSALKTRVHQLEGSYTSYDNMVEKFTSVAYNLIISK